MKIFTTEAKKIGIYEAVSFPWFFLCIIHKWRYCNTGRTPIKTVRIVDFHAEREKPKFCQDSNHMTEINPFQCTNCAELFNSQTNTPVFPVPSKVYIQSR